jgi:hypothetical protein
MMTCILDDDAGLIADMIIADMIEHNNIRLEQVLNKGGRLGGHGGHQFARVMTSGATAGGPEG